MPLQKLIPAAGPELNLRDNTKYVVPADGFGMKPHTTRVLTEIAGGGAVMARDEDNWLDTNFRCVVKGKPFTVRRANRDAIINLLAAASLHTKTQGRQGVAAFYAEQWGDDPTPDVYPIVTGRLIESNRTGFAAYFDMTLDLTLRQKL